MKLIIELDDKDYELAKADKVSCGYQCRHIMVAVKNGTPYNPSGDAISRRVMKGLISDKSIPIKFEEEKRGEWRCALGMPLGDIYTVIDNAPPVPLTTEEPKPRCTNCGGEVDKYNYCKECGYKLYDVTTGNDIMRQYKSMLPIGEAFEEGDTD